MTAVFQRPQIAAVPPRAVIDFGAPTNAALVAAPTAIRRFGARDFNPTPTPAITIKPAGSAPDEPQP